ncbi:unnamed protein product [Adineta ricciae]|uniref:RING-type domain-containing protein n=1 Tax=Adineta ricciae TaxID=249248 RepID=A0A814M9M3_ADIRI|nr:unnamed protein product [Adineta ricciae]CAF1247328.1 unnamed protein product [Adineta ricciae]
MACYLPDHLVRCLICKNLFSDARRLRCGCVYCYLCCLKIANNYTLSCPCSAIHRFQTQIEFEKSLVIDSVVNDLVSQHIKKKQNSARKLVDYDVDCTSPSAIEEDTRFNDHQTSISVCSSNIRKQVAVAQPPCTICKKKSHLIVLCEHCQCDICELCIGQHYQSITDVLHEKWKQCKDKFHQINEHVLLSHQNRTDATSKLDTIRRTIEDRSQNLKTIIDQHRQTLATRIDNHMQNLEKIVKTNNVDNDYQSIRERLPNIFEEQTNVSDLVAFLGETEDLLEKLVWRDKQIKEIEMKIPYLSQADAFSINISQFIGELKFDDQSSSTDQGIRSTTSDNQEIKPSDNVVSPLALEAPERTRFPRRMRSSFRSRGAERGIQHLSHLLRPPARNYQYSRNSRSSGSRYSRGRGLSYSHTPLLQPNETNFDTIPNNRYQWSISFKDIPFFLYVLDNRNRARQADVRAHHKHDYMLFISDNYGRLGVYSLPKYKTNLKPSIIGTGELFPKNSRLLLESFTVYEFAIVVYVRRFEQRSNEIEHSKLIKAGLPILKGEQGRCNDHGGMIYLFSHGGEEIDGVYQSHPIRAILADQIYGCLWALNPMENNVYCYMTPNKVDEIRKCLQAEEILLDLSEELFEPSIMIQSDHSIGLIDVERDVYRLYSKDDKLRLITMYENSCNQQWKLTDGVIFKDNRSLLKLSEDICYNSLNERSTGAKSHSNPRRQLMEITSDGQEKRRIQADTLYGIALGPDDELIMGFSLRGERVLSHIISLQMIFKEKFCRICFQTFNDPRRLPCKHIFCFKCIPCLQCDDSDSRDQIVLACRICLRHHRFDDWSAVKYYVTLHCVPYLTALQCDEQMIPVRESSCPVCFNVVEEKLEYCHHCQKNLCNQCLISHRMEVKKSILQTIEQCRRFMRRTQQHVEQTRNKLENMKLHIDICTSERNDQVDAYTVSLLAQIDEQKLHEETNSTSGYESFGEQRTNDNNDSLREQYKSQANIALIETTMAPIGLLGELVSSDSERSIAPTSHMSWSMSCPFHPTHIVFESESSKLFLCTDRGDVNVYSYNTSNLAFLQRFYLQTIEKSLSLSVKSLIATRSFLIVSLNSSIESILHFYSHNGHLLRSQSFPNEYISQLRFNDLHLWYLELISSSIFYFKLDTTNSECTEKTQFTSFKQQSFYPFRFALNQTRVAVMDRSTTGIILLFDKQTSAYLKRFESQSCDFELSNHTLLYRFLHSISIIHIDNEQVQEEIHSSKTINITLGKLDHEFLLSTYTNESHTFAIQCYSK